MSTSLLKQQHAQMAEIILELTSYPIESLVEKAFEISRKIGQLAGILTFHLQSEDKFLYPSLIKNESSQIRSTAVAFTREMGDLGQKFATFKAKYMQPKNIKTDPKKFKEELDAIAALLDNRIKKEERELYPLLGK